MTRSRKDVENGLLAKGFRKNDANHHYFIYYDLTGKKTPVKTKTSHSGKDLDDFLLAQMARQIHLAKRQFLDLVDCPLSREEYDRLILLHLRIKAL